MKSDQPVSKSSVVSTVLLSLLSVILFFGVGEIAIRLYLKSHILYDIEMSRYAVLAKQDSKDPRVGHTHRSGVQVHLMGVDFRTNSDGLRDGEHSIAKDGRYRIIFLGDSLTMGWGVEESKIFKSILEKELSKNRPTEILNFGVGNYNTEQEVYSFLDKGLKYHPDQVVVFYFINDAEPTPHRSTLSVLENSLLLTFYWSRIHAAISNLTQSGGFKEYYSSLYREGSEGWQHEKQAFHKLKEVAEKEKMDVRVVLLPELHELQSYPFQREHAMLISQLSADKIPSIDLAPSFRGQRNPMDLWVAKDDAHPNAKAHALIAEYTKHFIEQMPQGEKSALVGGDYAE